MHTVPDIITVEELDRLVDEKYNEVDGGEYTDDCEYWERGECYWEKALPVAIQVKTTEKYIEREINYGADIDILCRLLEEGKL